MLTERRDASLEAKVGAALRRFREQRGLTQEELAFRCNIHRTYVSQLERGLKSPTLRLLWGICACLDVAPSRFVASVESGDREGSSRGTG
ncbi:MAG: helix-turn-helix transcriptional regulator [Armatimonadetes bacterium]|nr:helix-turn-helix transcriptional regulator [Armatimonadota bacterium]